MEKKITINEAVEELKDIKARLVRLEKMTLKDALRNDISELRRRVGVIGAQIHQLQSSNA